MNARARLRVLLFFSSPQAVGHLLCYFLAFAIGLSALLHLRRFELISSFNPKEHHHEHQ
jgi:hypothetical protein